jgi:hypothetical protein
MKKKNTGLKIYMRRSIENKLISLENKLNPDPSVCGEIIVYDGEKGIPEELLQDDSVIRVFIPDNHRDPEFEPIFKESLKQATERARARIKIKSQSEK